jgi:hypothetical protein
MQHMHNWKEDAREFGRFVKKGGWYVAYLAARRVVEGTGNGRPAKNAETSERSEVSAAMFAKEAGLSDKTVTAYLRTWDRAADNGVVPPRTTFVGTEHNVPLPDDDVEAWSEWHSATMNAGRHVADPGRRSALIEQANADGVGASKVLDVASNKRAVVAAIKADPALASAVAADAAALLAVHREENLNRAADDTFRRKMEHEHEREPLSVSDGLVLIGVNSTLRGVLDRATAAAADGKGYVPEMREAMLLAVEETLTLSTALREVLTGTLGQPITDEALSALLDGGQK